jgi:hypothetical protein
VIFDQKMKKIRQKIELAKLGFKLAGLTAAIVIAYNLHMLFGDKDDQLM